MQPYCLFTHLSPLLYFVETPLTFVDDHRTLEKEMPVKRCASFLRVKHINVPLAAKVLFKISQIEILVSPYTHYTLLVYFVQLEFKGNHSSSDFQAIQAGR